MDLVQLRSFLRVAESGSITRAAEELCLTQPAVTQQVRALERDLGVPLLERTGRGVRLTQAGETLCDYARRSLALLEEGRQVIADLRGGSAGRLVVGAGVTTSIFLLPGWLRAFQERQPGVEVVVRTGRSREVVRMVLEREVDLGLVTSPPLQPELVVEELFEEEILLVARAEHPLAGRRLSASEFAGAPLVLFSRGSGFRAYLDSALARSGLLPRVKMESDSVEAIKSFVAVGLGISFLPSSAVAAEEEAGELARIAVDGLPEMKRRTAVVYRPDRYLAGGPTEFLALLPRI